MSITREVPNTIVLGGPVTVVNDLAATEQITPGMLIERTDVAGVAKFKKHAGQGLEGSIYATEQSMLNLTVDDVYAAADLVEAAVGAPGATIWALVASGANVAAGAKLCSGGNGLLEAVGGGDLTIAVVLEATDNSAGPGNARIKVEVV